MSQLTPLGVYPPVAILDSGVSGEFPADCVAICAMVPPGISGSLILVAAVWLIEHSWGRG